METKRVRIREWRDMKVLILGAARQGIALTRYLVQHGASVILSDQKAESDLKSAQDTLAEYPIKWVFGIHPLDLLDEVDILCVSGGVPLTQPIIQGALQRNIPVTNDSQIFLEQVPCKVIGITGSAGKTTTTTLVGLIAQEAQRQFIPDFPFKRIWVGGNIGIPLIDLVNEIQPNDLVILELSSFQLELMTISPEISAVLNITPNHLDRHKTMQAYIAAKSSILRYQNEWDSVILSRDDACAWEQRSLVQGRLYSFGMTAGGHSPGSYEENGVLYYQSGFDKVELLQRTCIQLRGNHNIQNVLAACTISIAAGLPLNAIQVAVKNFKGVPHRLELVRLLNQTAWYNDSIATAPERSIAAIESFNESLVLLAGGRDKDLPWGAFADLVNTRVKHLILFGEAAGIIGEAIATSRVSTRTDVINCVNLSEAVQAAAKIVQPGDVVLLSPGGTSFDEFRDFEERGECFRKMVMEL